MSEVQIHDWRPQWRDDFASLNREWLERYFSVEEIDRRVLGDPETWILAPGGRIFFALDGARVIGTVALLREADGIYEVSKMAVQPDCQGRGIGRRLLLAAIDWFRGVRGTRLFLESSTRLGPALHLYESLGFEHHGLKPDSHYVRSDVYMVWRDPTAPAP
jgi:putative acetyltransferase